MNATTTNFLSLLVAVWLWGSLALAVFRWDTSTPREQMFIAISLFLAGLAGIGRYYVNGQARWSMERDANKRNEGLQKLRSMAWIMCALWSVPLLMAIFIFFMRL
jgi:hypothetical protein